MRKSRPRVLSIDPWHRGFGFVVLEGPTDPVDWGVKFSRNDHINRGLMNVQMLVTLYKPKVVLLETQSSESRRRSVRLQNFCERIRDLAAVYGIKAIGVRKDDVTAFFAKYGSTKQEVALAVVQKLPQFSRLYPRRRKPWAGEDHRMQIFDAAALALTFYASS